MSQDGLPPPPPECLRRLYPSTQKGGTLIVEDVLDYETHERRRADPDGYRPSRCGRCGHDRLHVHDYRSRKLRGQSGQPETCAVRYRCPKCLATWQMLPLFIARWLWRSWKVVQAATQGPPPAATEPQVPARTVRRWTGRLATAALLITQALAVSGGAVWIRLAQLAAGPGWTRAELVQLYARETGTPAQQQYASLAALLHRLAPGQRLT